MNSMIQKERTKIHLLASAAPWTLKLRTFPNGSLPSSSRVGQSEPSERTAVLRMLVTCHLSIPEKHIGQDLPLNRLGLDPLGLLHLAAAIDLELGVYVPPERFAEGLTIARLTALVVLGSPSSERQPDFSELVNAADAAGRLPEIAVAA